MLSVLLIWIYMTFTCYVIGFSLLSEICDRQGYTVKKECSYLIAGIAAVTVYAQFFSLVHKVAGLANILLLCICGLCIVWKKKQFREHFRTWRMKQKENAQKSLGKSRMPGEYSRFLKPALFLALVLVFTYGTSTGMIHYDTGLYHAQSIRWIEEYGVVPGLGNLHSRLAYNSASFCLTALYSFAFLGGQSYHVTAGYLALLLAITCVEGFAFTRLKNPRLADLVRVMAVYYLLIIFDEMVSPASDYFMVLCVFFLVICWLDLLAEKEKSYVPYGLLCVLGVFVVSVKLSGAVILLLVLKPAMQMIREKRGKEIALFLGLGLVTVLPYLIRNVVLSGWLVYPFTFIDLFDTDFKIPKGVAEYDAREIQVWGRGVYDVSRFEEPITGWFAEWLSTLDKTNLGFLFLALVALVVLAGMIIFALVKKKKEMTDFLLVAGTLGCCFLFWLTSAPLVRYGCVYLWVFPVLVWGYLYLKLTAQVDKGKLYLVVVLLLGCYKTGALIKETVTFGTTEYFIRQKDYENFETIPYELHGYTFYYPAEGDRTGYDDFPAAPMKAEDIFRGETIEEGFKDVVHDR